MWRVLVCIGLAVIQTYADDFAILSSQTDTAIYTASPITSTTSFSWTSITGSLTITDNARAVDYDPVSKQIYWMERMIPSGRVRRSDVDGSNEQDVATVNFGRGLTLDIYNRDVYWTTQNDEFIYTIPMDLSTSAAQIPNTDGTGDWAGCIDYGPITESLYVGFRNGFVKRYSLDGSTQEVLCDNLDKIPGIAVDEKAGELFIMETDNSATDWLWRYDLNTKQKTLMFTETANSGGSRGIAIYKNLVYVTDLKTDVIYAIPRDAAGLLTTEQTVVTNTFATGGAGFFDIHFYEEPTACVANLVVTVDSSSQLTVTWDDPVPGCCLADWFKITAVPSNADLCEATTTTEADTKLIDWHQAPYNTILTDLLPNTEYFITVTSGLTDDDNPSVINSGLVLDITGTTAQDVPTGVPGLSITAASDTSVSLLFSEPPCGYQNGLILSYTYSCKVGLQSTPVGTTLVATPRATLSDLLCDDGLYTCYAAAVTSAGPGPSAEIVVNGNIATVPTSKPCNLKLTEATATQITFTWERCECGTRGGVMQTYTYKLTSNGYTTESGNTDELMVSFELPLCAADYEFEVAVTTPAGIGPYAEMSLRNDEALASEPVVTLVSVYIEEVVVVVMAPPCMLDEATIISYVWTLYRISIKRQIEIVSTGEVAAEEDGTTAIQIPYLSCASKYELSIAAKSAGGVGPETIVPFQTEDSPNPFLPGSSLGITSSNPSTSTVSWENTVPLCPPPTVYNVAYTLTNLEQCSVPISRSRIDLGSTSDTEIILQYLNGGSTYEVSVTALTATGMDVVLQETWITPESAPTAPPTNIHINEFSADELVIAWDAPPCGTRGGPITYTYELITVSDDSKAIPLIHNTLDTTARIKPLPAGYVRYIFKVATVNSAGMIFSDYINIFPAVTPTTKRTDPCPDGLCQNGGTCFPDDGSCRCPTGFSGIQCEVQAERSTGTSDATIVAIAVILSAVAVVLVGTMAYCCVRLRRRNANKYPHVQPIQNPTIKSASVVVWDSQYPGTGLGNQQLEAPQVPNIISPWDTSLQLIPSGRQFQHRYF
ncbi:uncharacterized protein [Amphiura filiformis]|uniref:uncharacterized protein n=1 Tax=Amphiura filiformis TaxID=82378 RepID=UPI003B21B095